jgi:tetratricopeptide (TPR) repeat protein
MPELQEGSGELPRNTRPLYLESIHGRRRYGWAPLAGFLAWPEKFVSAPTPELYDLGRDPREIENLFDRENEQALESRLDEVRQVNEEFDAAADPGVDVDLERLTSLGYVGGSGVAQPEDELFEGAWPDPKDRIGAIPEIDRGLVAMAAGREAEARSAFEAALRLDPDNLLALNDLGLLALRAGDATRAEGYFRDVLRRDDRAETTANNLGLALGYQNRFAEAEGAFRQALGVRPSFTMARFNLAFVLHQQGSSREALRELERVQSEEPGFPGLPGFMGEVRRAVASSPGRS